MEARNNTTTHINDTTRNTVWQQRDDATGVTTLIGREGATAREANVFGDGAFHPVGASSDRGIVFEAQVRHSFNATADDDPEDRGEFYLFRLWRWDIGENGPLSEIFMSWQDFVGDDPPGGEYGWDSLLRVAIERMRRVRYDRQVFEPITVGVAQPDQKGAPDGSGEG